jgi:hypothetical protein
MARQLVAEVVRKLIEKLAREIKRSFTGSKNRRRSPIKLARNFDAKGTVRSNLAGWDKDKKRLLIKKPLFFSRTRRHCENGR